MVLFITARKPHFLGTNFHPELLSLFFFFGIIKYCDNLGENEFVHGSRLQSSTVDKITAVGALRHLVPPHPELRAVDTCMLSILIIQSPTPVHGAAHQTRSFPINYSHEDSFPSSQDKTTEQIALDNEKWLSYRWNHI